MQSSESRIRDISHLLKYFAELGEFERFLPADLAIYLDGGTGRSATSPFVRANLEHFLPSIQSSAINELIRDIFWHQGLASVIEPKYPHLLHATSISDEYGSISDAAGGKASIFCTFHYGGYRLVASALWRAGISYDLIVASDVATAQADAFYNQLSNAEKEFGKCGEFTISIADDPRSIATSLKNLKRGRSLLFYIDGNLGSGGAKPQGDRLVSVPFLGREILARRGIAFISQRSGVPIIPIIANRAHGWIPAIETFEPIHPVHEKCLDEQAAITRYLYGILQAQLLVDPAQWEGWLYVHKFLPHLTAVPLGSGHVGRGTNLEFNIKVYDLVKKKGIPFLFHKPDYRFFELKHELYYILTEIKKGMVNVDDLKLHGLSKSAISSLTAKGILTNVDSDEC